MMKKWILGIMIVGTFIFTGCANNIKSGVEALETKNYDEAKDFFEQEIEKGKHLDEAYRGIGIACFELEAYDDAIEAFKLALKNETEETAILYSMMGACYMQTMEYEKALEVYKKALSMEDITDNVKQEVQYNLIAVYENMADWDAAKKQMKEYKKAYPDDERIEKEADFLETR